MRKSEDRVREKNLQMLTLLKGHPRSPKTQALWEVEVTPFHCMTPSCRVMHEGLVMVEIVNDKTWITVALDEGGMAVQLDDESLDELARDIEELRLSRGRAPMAEMVWKKEETT